MTEAGQWALAAAAESQPQSGSLKSAQDLLWQTRMAGILAIGRPDDGKEKWRVQTKKIKEIGWCKTERHGERKPGRCARSERGYGMRSGRMIEAEEGGKGSKGEYGQQGIAHGIFPNSEAGRERHDTEEAKRPREGV